MSLVVSNLHWKNWNLLDQMKHYGKNVGIKEIYDETSNRSHRILMKSTIYIYLPRIDKAKR